VVNGEALVSENLATIWFSPERPDLPGSFNAIAIRTGGDESLRRLIELCRQLARGELTSCDLLRDLPADGRWVAAFRAHRGRRDDEKSVVLVTSEDLELCVVHWILSPKGWKEVRRRLQEFLAKSDDRRLVLTMSDVEWAEHDAWLTVER
jgi:hypothetical protein